MAEVQDIFGKKVVGKAGPASFYTLFGKTIMRSLPGKRTGPQSPQQVRNQERFKAIRAFCSPFKDVVIPQIWNSLATTSSGYHLFMKTNSPAFDMDGILSDPMKIRLSMGKLPLPQGMKAHRTSEGSTTIAVQWDKDPSLGGLPARDQLMVISSAGGKFSEMKPTGLTRADLAGTFELPPMAEPASHVYLFFQSLDLRYYSESMCCAL
ncbi:MAG TPA: hypothetical protein VGK10_06245 [Prolixibacteraceae bacterium]|jgi:hypothetical protein